MGTIVEPPARVGTGLRPPAAEGPISMARGIRHILVCLDRSAFSEQSLPYAVGLAKTFGSSLTLLHVLQASPESGARGTDPLDWEMARQEAKAHLARLERDTARESGLRVDSRVEQGHPAERIATLSRELGADLTVLGSHGQGGMTAWELGSTVQQVLSVAQGSVLINRATAPELRRPGAPARILIPLDGSPRTESVIPTAARIATSNGAEVFLVHVVHEPQPSAVLSAEGDLVLAKELATRIEAGAHRYLDRLQDQLVRELPSVRTLVLRQVDERESLIQVIAQENVELVVLSAHGCTCNPTRPFGSMAWHLLMHATVPVLVLSDLPARGAAKASDADDQQIAPPLRASFTPEEG